MVVYHHTAREVAPKKVALAAAEEELALATERLDQARTRLKDIKDGLADMHRTYEKKQKEAEQLELEKKREAEQLERELSSQLDCEKAKEALKNLKVRDLQEVGKYSSPPGGVALVMQAVLTIRGVGPNIINKHGVKEKDWWTPSRDLLRDAEGLQKYMLQYEAENMPPTCVKALTKFVEDEKFQPAVVKTPKRRELEASEAELKVVESSLAMTMKKLADIEAD
eukprot:gene58113-biopygen63628